MGTAWCVDMGFGDMISGVWSAGNAYLRFGVYLRYLCVVEGGGKFPDGTWRVATGTQ